MKQTRTWVVVADGARARVFENTGPGKGLYEVPGSAVDQPDPASRDIGTDRPGRGRESAGAGKHAMQPRTDLHDHAEQKFANALAARLNAARPRNEFDRLILIAAPKTLGHLRAALAPQTAKLVTGEIDKDLTGRPQEEIERQVAAIAAI